MKQQRIICTVTNTLAYDQRMQRICTSLANAGYTVQLTGIRNRNTEVLPPQVYAQKRLFCFFKKGFGFYAEYNIRLFFYLLFAPCDVLCCIDLDTMLPVYLAGRLRRKKLVYDAHEYFSQQKEIITRPRVYKVWHWIERTFVPRFKYGYTVSSGIAAAFKQQYGVDYGVIMNATVLQPYTPPPPPTEKVIVYQGAVNEARGLEYLVPAMWQIPARLLIYGDGNYMEACRKLVANYSLEDTVVFKGKLLPAELQKATAGAYIGLNLVENNGLNQYYSLANKFFDYIHQCIPQVSMAYPAYQQINEHHQVAILIEEPSEQNIVNAVNELLTNDTLYRQLQQNCLLAREMFCWQQEEKKLLIYYQQITSK